MSPRRLAGLRQHTPPPTHPPHRCTLPRQLPQKSEATAPGGCACTAWHLCGGQQSLELVEVRVARRDVSLWARSKHTDMRTCGVELRKIVHATFPSSQMTFAVSSMGSEKDQISEQNWPMKALADAFRPPGSGEPSRAAWWLRAAVGEQSAEAQRTPEHASISCSRSVCARKFWPVISLVTWPKLWVFFKLLPGFSETDWAWLPNSRQSTTCRRVIHPAHRVSTQSERNAATRAVFQESSCCVPPKSTHQLTWWRINAMRRGKDLARVGDSQPDIADHRDAACAPPDTPKSGYTGPPHQTPRLICQPGRPLGVSTVLNRRREQPRQLGAPAVPGWRQRAC